MDKRAGERGQFQSRVEGVVVGGGGRSARVITGEADAAATDQAVTFCLYARQSER